MPKHLIKTIRYHYTYNRLDSIVYPNNPQNNVRYTYGDSTAGNNQRGRIALLEDALGFQIFIYGKMGEVTENNRTFVLPNESHPYSFKMKYTYDSWNRILDITYPDREKVPHSLDTLLNLPAHWSAHHTTYWQHSDHLGSASWGTDTNGLGYQHLLYMPWGEPLFDQRVVNNTYETRYTFSGKERDEETGYSYFGARYYNSDLSIWLSVDPMADKYPSTSPYTYCGNNPVVLKDPNGRDWVEREYKETKEVYYDRSVKSQADIDKKYGANSGVHHLADGSGVGNDRYTVYNDSEKNKYGYIINNATGKIVNNDRTVIEGNDYIIYAGVTEESLDASTLHNNYMGTSYTGPNNPKCYNGTDCYDYNPTNLSEIFSKTHDLQYSDLNAKGIKGALLQTNTWKADMQLSISNAVSIPFNPDPKDRMRSAATAVAFGFIGTYKMAANFAKKGWNVLFGK